MPVPNTNSFNLQDVTKEIYGSSIVTGNLSKCFTDATGTFDATYVGSKNGLLNFRNYVQIFSTGYGFLYNWYTVEVDSRNIAPLGWHVPTTAEWTTLINYLGGDYVAGYKLTETGLTHWNSPNSNATNSSGFSGRGGGKRGIDGYYSGYRTGALFWSTTSVGNNGGIIVVGNDLSNGYVIIASNAKAEGSSIRCIKDNSVNNGSVTDIDGNIYSTVSIGTQVWMASNLKVSRYRDGTAIPNVKDSVLWGALITGG